jgi:adenylate kinase
MRIVFIGPPGSGKGTYSARIAPILKIPHISTGDIFRGEAKKGTALGIEVSGYMSRGDLVPDETTIKVLKERLDQPDATKGFILDGYPRTLNQTKELENITKIDVVILLSIPEDILFEKLTARRVCSKCGETYNVADIHRTINGVKYDFPPMNPKKAGICDVCGGKLVQRKDDTLQVIQERMEVYKKQTEPLIEFYRKQGLLEDFHISGGVDETIPKILQQLKRMERTHQ